MVRGIRGTIGILITGAGVTAALTLVYLSMRAVMDVGGSCSSGGSSEIRVQCPGHVAAIMPVAIWGGLIFAGLYVWQTASHHVSSLVSLLWPALFLSLGWNFIDYGIRGGGVAAGSLIPGVVFMLMGGLPLFFAIPGIYRHLVHGEEPTPPWHVSATGSAVSALKTLSRLQRPGANMAENLERLDALHRSGGLDDFEYAKAKDRIIRGEKA